MANDNYKNDQPTPSGNGAPAQSWRVPPSPLSSAATSQQSQRRVSQVVFSVAANSSIQALDAHLKVARAVILTLQRQGGGELVFYASPALKPQRKHELLGMVGILTAELGPSAVSVNVQFGAKPSGPGLAPAGASTQHAGRAGLGGGTAGGIPATVD